MPDPKLTAAQKTLAKLTDQLKAAQAAKSDATEKAMNAARDRIAKRYDERIAVLQKQIGALRG
jgi:hypothetical protein